MLDPNTDWQSWDQADARQDALYGAFCARAGGPPPCCISFQQLCGALRDLELMNEVVAEETEAFLQLEVMQARLAAGLTLPTDDEQHLRYGDVETLYNAAVTFQSGKAEDGRLLTAEERIARFPRVNRVADPDSGKTVLHEAVDAGDVELAQYLIDFGADVDFPRHDGSTPLFIASQQGWAQMVGPLLAQPPPNAHSAQLSSQMHPSSSAPGHPKHFTALLPVLLTLALLQVGVLAAAGSDPHKAVNKMGATPFYIACHKGHTAVLDELCRHGNAYA